MSPASEAPWVKTAQGLLETWEKVAPCMPKYQAFLGSHKSPGELGKGFLHDLRMTQQAQGGRAMSEEAQVALGEFYLAVALQMRPKEIDTAGEDAAALLSVARKCAEEDFEPFVEGAREFVSDYDAAMHRALEETCPLYEVDEALFWRANFDVAAPAEFNHFLTALGHGSGQGHVPAAGYSFKRGVPEAVEHVWEGLSGGDAAFEPARRAAMLVYEKWLTASSAPVKATISKLLMEHGLLVSEDVHDSNKMLPVVPALWPASA